MFALCLRKLIFANCMVFILEGVGTRFVMEQWKHYDAPELYQVSQHIADMTQNVFMLYVNAGIIFTSLKFDWLVHSNIDTGLRWLFTGLYVATGTEPTIVGCWGGIPRNIPRVEVAMAFSMLNQFTCACLFQYHMAMHDLVQNGDWSDITFAGRYVMAILQNRGAPTGYTSIYLHGLLILLTWIRVDPEGSLWMQWIGKLIRSCAPYVGESFADHPDAEEIRDQLASGALTKPEATRKLARFWRGGAVSVAQFIEYNRSDWRNALPTIPGITKCIDESLGFKAYTLEFMKRAAEQDIYLFFSDRLEAEIAQCLNLKAHAGAVSLKKLWEFDRMLPADCCTALKGLAFDYLPKCYDVKDRRACMLANYMLMNRFTWVKFRLQTSGARDVRRGKLHFGLEGAKCIDTHAYDPRKWNTETTQLFDQIKEQVWKLVPGQHVLVKMSVSEEEWIEQEELEAGQNAWDRMEELNDGNDFHLYTVMSENQWQQIQESQALQRIKSTKLHYGELETAKAVCLNRVTAGVATSEHSASVGGLKTLMAHQDALEDLTNFCANWLDMAT